MRTPNLSQLSFRTKILLYAVLVGTASLIFVGGALLIQDTYATRRDFSQDRQNEGDFIVRSCAAAVSRQNADFANLVLQGLVTSPTVDLAAIYLPDNSILAKYTRGEPLADLGPAPGPAGSEYSERQLRTTVPIVFQGQRVGTLLISSFRPAWRPRLKKYTRLFLAVSAVSLLLSLVLATSFRSTLLRPVRELEATARSITHSHDYTTRAKKFTDDELGELTDSFNDMLSRIQEREQDLKQSENRFSGLLSRLGEAVFKMTVPDLVIEYCSPAAESVFGYTAAEFLARPGLLTEICHPESAGALRHEFDRLLAGHTSEVWEYLVVDPDGQQRRILQTNTFETDDCGRIVALAGCCTDTSKRHQAQLEKQRLEIELQQAHKLEALGTLAGGIAHDFNNILEAILGYTDLAAADLPPEHPVQEFFVQVRRAGTRATHLVRQILTFSRRSDQGKIPVQLDGIVQEALALLLATVPKSVVLELDSPSDLSSVVADADQIHQIIMNLCTNAIYAMEPDGGRIRLTVNELDLKANHPDLLETMVAGRHLQLLIDDTGTGIEPDILDRIFEPFFTTKPQGEGTGMGLAMVYGIVRDHRGNITVTSQPGKGTIFRILLPIADDALTAPVQPRKHRVLFVDDEEVLVQLVQRTLAPMGYNITAFSDPLVALETLCRKPGDFDILVTDMTMPGMSGLELAKSVKTVCPDLPVIICSGYSTAIVEDGDVQIAAFARKPLAMTDLATLIEKTICGASAGDESVGLSVQDPPS